MYVRSCLKALNKWALLTLIPPWVSSPEVEAPSTPKCVYVAKWNVKLIVWLARPFPKTATPSAFVLGMV